MSKEDLMFGERMEGLGLLAIANLPLRDFLDKLKIYDFVHGDHKSVLFRAGGYDTFEGIDSYLKYVTDSKSAFQGNLQNTVLSENIQKVVLRGLKIQYALREIDGIQKISQPDFINGIVGLIGLLEFVEGYNLGEREKVERNLHDLGQKLKVFEDFERTIKRVHEAGYVYSDGKPGNLLVGFNGLTRLIDFSTAASFSDNDKDRFNGTVYGTLGYFDVESIVQASRDRDFLALGVTLAEVLLDLNKKELLTHLGSDGKKCGLDLVKFEELNAGKLETRFGYGVSNYFRHLMNRPWPYSTAVVHRVRDVVLDPYGNSGAQGETCSFLLGLN